MNKLKAQIGYKRRHVKGGKASRIAANVLKRPFNLDSPNTAWVSDIMYVRTYESFLYVATVIDLFSRRVVGWSMDKNMDKHLVIKALLMAVFQRRPKSEVLVHSDQGSQYGSSALQQVLELNNKEYKPRPDRFTIQIFDLENPHLKIELWRHKYEYIACGFGFSSANRSYKRYLLQLRITLLKTATVNTVVNGIEKIPP